MKDSEERVIGVITYYLIFREGMVGWTTVWKKGLDIRSAFFYRKATSLALVGELKGKLFWQLKSYLYSA